VSIDADLQDDVAVIESMVTAFIGGAEVVYGVRDSRQSTVPSSESRRCSTTA